MPLREYICKDCGEVTENLERTEEERLTLCPRCQSEGVEKRITSYGGYQGSFGGASTTPKGSGAFSGRKR